MKTTKNEISKVIALNTRYAAQSLSEIPVGYWIDKSVGGCGLSFLALTDNNNSIILMPRNKLIENKASQKDKYKNLFVVNVGVSKSDVYDYIDKMKKLKSPVKILTTYDSFALGKLDYLLEEKICRIYVDESQFVLDFALSQPILVNELHNRLSKNINVTTFFSAHPPKREYLPKYIQDMPAIKYTWANQIKATPYIINTDKPYMIATKILSELLITGECIIGDLRFKKAVVFLNSVEGLRRIIEPLNSKENIAYVVGDTVRNDSKLNEFAHSLVDCDKLPKITVGTTSLISGFDLYDEDTLNIVISTSTKEFTLMDKELDVPQAITRQRLDSNPNNDKFIFILDVKDMENKIIKLEETFNTDLKRLNTVVENLNYLMIGNKDCTVGYELYEGYYFMSNNNFVVNESMLKARMYIFKELYNQYKKGYNVIATNKPIEARIINVDRFNSKQYSDFANEIKYADTIGEKLTILNSVHNKEWKEYLTYGLEKNNLLIKLKDAKIFYESRNDYKGIIIAIRKMYKIGSFYSSADTKEQLQELYNKKGLNRSAKSTDLYEFFELKSNVKRIDNKLVKGFIIESAK